MKTVQTLVVALLACAGLNAAVIPWEGVSVNVNFDGTATTIVAGAGLDLDDFAGLFDIDFAGDLITVTAIQDYTPSGPEFLLFTLNTAVNSFVPADAIRNGDLSTIAFGNGPSQTLFGINSPITTGQFLTIQRAVTDVAIAAPVPEPGTYALMASGLVGMIVYARRRRA